MEVKEAPENVEYEVVPVEYGGVHFIVRCIFTDHLTEDKVTHTG